MIINEITENFTVDDDNEYKWSSDNIGTPSKFGKGVNFKPFRTTVDGIITYSLYQAKDASILRPIKRANYNSPDGQHLINRTVVCASRVLRSLNIDVIVTPKSSSLLVKTFSENFAKRVHVDFQIESFVKGSNIVVDKEHPKITQRIMDYLEDILRSYKDKNEPIELKSIHPMYRKFIKNVFEPINGLNLNKFKGKNVLIVDDIITSGTSIINIAHHLKNNGAKSITGLTLFKSK